jgi:hypothetical protein
VPAGLEEGHEAPGEAGQVAELLLGQAAVAAVEADPSGQLADEVLVVHRVPSAIAAASRSAVES